MPDEWLRYSCQLALPGFGKETQVKLQKAKVLIVGAGGLGCPAAQYLASSGVGTIGIADDDVISASNLHRQVLYTPGEIGLFKADIASRKLFAQNPQINLVPLGEKITAKNVIAVIGDYDIIVDCTDNFETKYLLNDACVISGKPLVYGAIYQYEGQIAVLNILNKDGTRSPNYRDFFPGVNATEISNCAIAGVIPPIAGIIGCMQAAEVIKFITGLGEILSGKMLILDSSTMLSRIIKIGSVTKTIITSLTTISGLPGTNTISLISPAELKKGINSNLYELIDVRNTAERNEFHIGGSHIPLEKIESGGLSSDLNKTIVFYCEYGKRSAEAARIARNTFPGKDFFSLQGGLNAWKNEK
jgi:sulfur-carrier protein adenylyltransferase/sulfurtransferase